MASTLNETGRSEESIRRNPAVVFDGDSSFFGTDWSAWALPTATLLGSYSRNVACSLGLVETKTKQRSIFISLLRLRFPIVTIWLFLYERSASKGSRGLL